MDEGDIGFVCADTFGGLLSPRKQEELVYSVRKRLEEALMADMLAHVEEAAAGEADSIKDEGDGSEDMESV